MPRGTARTRARGTHAATWLQRLCALPCSLSPAPCPVLVADGPRVQQRAAVRGGRARGSHHAACGGCRPCRRYPGVSTLTLTPTLTPTLTLTLTLTLTPTLTLTLTLTLTSTLTSALSLTLILTLNPNPNPDPDSDP